MNERIRQLVDKSTSYKEGLIEGKYDIEVFDKEKFAELLIQECLTFVRPNSYFQAYPDNMIGGEDGVKLLQTITNQIEEHFGVEE